MKHKTYKIYWVVITLLLPIITFSQRDYESNIYNNKGQLIIDTTLKINKDQFYIWDYSEDNILAIISNSIDYSNLARESGIEGIVIISFECDTLDLKNIRLLKKAGGGLDENVINGIKKISKKIVSEFIYIQNIRKNEPIKYLGTYYIPFDFSLLNLTEEIKKKNAIPIIDTKVPLIAR